MKRIFKSFGIGATVLILLTSFQVSFLWAQTDYLRLAWSANSEANIWGYQVYYKSQGSGGPYNGTGADKGDSPIALAASSSPQITLSGLDPSLDYEFVLTALNAAGESGFSAPVRVFSIDNRAHGYGRVEPDGPIWVESGKSKTVAIIPDAGYRIDDVTINGVCQGAISEFIFSSVSANQRLDANFTADTADSDGDGITNHAEIHTYGTDPESRDSDQDGIEDGDELDYWGENWSQDIDGDLLVNLLDADSDGDGFQDGHEMSAFSDPADSGIVPETSQLALEFGEVEVDHNWKQVSFTGVYENPVVVANVPSFKGDQATTLRIRNVTQDGFKICVREWDYLDGWHTKETVGYMVMDAGTHYLDDGTMIIAGRIDTNRTGNFARFVFSDTFNVPPVVVTAVITENGGDTITVRQRKVSTSGFEFKLQEQESYGAHEWMESIAYVAWEPANGTIGEDIIFEVGHTGDTVGNEFHAFEFESVFNQPPALLGSMQSTDGGDPAALRWQNKDEYGAEIKVEEEQSQDSETGHTTETVGYMLFSAN